MKLLRRMVKRIYYYYCMVVENRTITIPFFVYVARESLIMQIMTGPGLEVGT